MVCGTGGRPINFLRKIKKISFMEALKELSDRVGINLNIALVNKKENNYTNYYNIMQKSQELYTRILLQTKGGETALEYLYKRGINDEIIKTFQIGLSSNNTNILYNVLKESDTLELDMIDLGLVNKGSTGYYDVFTKRIMFPIKDEDGNIIAYSGRTYLESKNKDEAKYVNSKETPIFIKGDVLYNIDNAAREIIKKNRVFLYEGFMDVIASTRSNIKEAICSMGTALTINQAKLIKKYTNNVIICYDADKAGINASKKAIEVLKQVGLNIKLLLLPDKLDPDDYVNKYSEEKFFEFCNDNILDPLEYNYKIILQENDLKDFSKLDDIKKNIFQILQETNSQSLNEVYLKRLSEDLNVSFASLVVDYNTYFNKTPVLKNVEISTQNQNNINENDFFDYSISAQDVYFQKTSDSLEKQQRCALRIMNYAKESRQKALYIDSKIELECMESRHQKLWMKLIDNYYETYEDFSFNTYLKLLTTEEQNWLFNDSRALENLPSEPHNDEDLEECICTLKLCKLEDELKFLMSKNDRGEYENGKQLELTVRIW